MSSITLSPNMSLPVPVVAVDPGPQYAIDIDSCLAILDQHSHVPGSGVAITPAAMNINAALTFNSNSATNLLTVRFSPQVSPIPATGVNIGCIYEAGVDLYYNDGAGNQIQLTKSGSVAGTSGSISGLVSPASASYNAISQTFIWQAGTNLPASLDAASIILRNPIVSSPGLTLSAPTLGGDYTITLPALPGSNLPLSIDATGIMSAAQISTPQIANGAVTTTQIANQTIAQGNLALRPTGSTVGAGGVATSNIPTATITTLVFTDITSVTITTTGRPVSIGLIAGDPTGGQSFIAATSATLRIKRDSTSVCEAQLSSSTGSPYELPPSVLNHIDFPTAGTYTYTIGGMVSALNLILQNATLIAYEL